MKRILNLVVTLFAISLMAIPVVSGATSKALVYNATVAKDGSGQYTSVQAAINAVPDDNKSRYIIYIKNGIYQETVVVPANKPFISLIGQSNTDTVITYNNGAGTPKPDGSGKTFGTSGSATFLIQGAGFTAENITFENAFDESSKYAAKGPQAVAVKADADKLLFKNCRFLGNQDTLYTNNGRQYYKDCYIQGDVDFIFGEATAVFEGCQIHSVYRSNGEMKGCITAPSTQSTTEYGLVFFNCELTGDPALGRGTVYLGRPWHSSKSGKYPQGDPGVHSQAFFINCKMGAHINPDGWTSMATGGFSWIPDNELFREYQSTGPGANSTNPLRKQLTEEQVKKLTIENILKGTDNWNPKTPVY